MSDNDLPQHWTPASRSAGDEAVNLVPLEGEHAEIMINGGTTRELA